MSIIGPSKIYCTELKVPSEHLRYHIITHEGYRQVSSSNAFFHGRTQHEKHWKRGIIWPSHMEYEHHLYTRKRFGFSIWEDDVEVVEHASIWDFYTYIGYDYKKKKWTPSP